ncbi:hypothetical protein CXB51_019242 [Gossypium anomalum]|uniref:GAG-pre-integrase domain-containing protein n=1 Tax=Gossypium anomalum TaxID=47600 RepID=A0A8J5YVS7_9ROSI|nr:hypothetical protein CXB51_019242 [Gossypium anomalum]
MRTYLQAFDLWEVVNTNAEPAPLRANPTVAQIKQHADERTKRYKAMSCIQNCVSDVIFTRIMACETPKQAWDRLKVEFQGTKRTRQQQLLNLRRDFENLKMKEEETFSEARIVEKVISTLPERYEVKISSLKDSRDLTSISLTELINALYAQEQRRASRLKEHQEGAFQAKTKSASSFSVCKEKGRPRQNQQQPRVEARVAEEGSDHEEQVFTVSCSAAQENVSNGWLLNSGCTNHMTPDASIFKSLEKSCKTKVKVGNGHFIKAEGNKLISNALLVPEIDRNLLSIAQLLEKGYSVLFKGSKCKIGDPSGSMLMTVAMTDKIFVVDWNKASNSAYTASIDESKLWYQRLRHANYRSMDQLSKEDLVENFINSVEKEEICEVCQLGNRSDYHFPQAKPGEPQKGCS